MRAIKIDVKKQEIQVIEIQPGLQGLYQAIECSTIELPVIFNGKHCLYVDEEGLLKPVESITGGFLFKEFPFQALIGNGIIVDTDEKGNDLDCTLSKEDVQLMINFLDAEMARNETINILTNSIHMLKWPGHI